MPDVSESRQLRHLGVCTSTGRHLLASGNNSEQSQNLPPAPATANCTRQEEVCQEKLDQHGDLLQKNCRTSLRRGSTWSRGRVGSVIILLCAAITEIIMCERACRHKDRQRKRTNKSRHEDRRWVHEAQDTKAQVQRNLTQTASCSLHRVVQPHCTLSAPSALLTSLLPASSRASHLTYKTADSEICLTGGDVQDFSLAHPSSATRIVCTRLLNIQMWKNPMDGE